MDAQPSFNLQSLVGQTLDGKVLLEAVLGQGGMGAVYRGKHLLLERPVAVKILRPEIVAVDGVMDRFFREARMAAAIDHPNIVTVYDFGTLTGGGSYLILELIEGVSLRALLQEKVVVEPGLAFAVFREICAAVETAHRKDIIHRDLKPENIMLKRLDDGGVMVKVLDFGLAKVVEAAETASSITKTGEILGTPVYMSPEHCDGGELDARSDVYGLGIILYELLTSQPPFRGRIASVLTSHIQKPPMPMRDLNPQLPEAIDEVVLSALEKSPEDRPASAKEFWERLEAAYTGAFGEKPPPEIDYVVPVRAPEPVAHHTTLKENEISTRGEPGGTLGGKHATIRESGTMIGASVPPAAFSSETRTNLPSEKVPTTDMVATPNRRRPVLAAGIAGSVLLLTATTIAVVSWRKPAVVAQPAPTTTAAPATTLPPTATPEPVPPVNQETPDPKTEPTPKEGDTAKGTTPPRPANRPAKAEKKKDDNVFKKMGRFFGIGGDKKDKKKNR